MTEIKLPARPEPDGFLTIRIIGREIEVNAYRDSTMEEYARAAVLADREARQQWISVDDRLPEWSMRDDTPCYLQGKPIGALLQSQLVLVTLDSGAVRMDRLEGIEDYGAPFWHTYRQRVVAWMPPPAPANAQPKRRPYNASGSLSEYGVFPECDAQQRAGAAGAEGLADRLGEGE